MGRVPAESGDLATSTGSKLLDGRAEAGMVLSSRSEWSSRTTHDTGLHITDAQGSVKTSDAGAHLAVTLNLTPDSRDIYTES